MKNYCCVHGFYGASSAAPFVAAEVAETTDVRNKAQISVIMWLKARWLVK